MKKFFSLVLALVMALSLTTVAWGAAVAKIGSDEYASLQDAIDAAEAANTVAIVIDLLDDATLDVTAWETLAIGSDVTTSITINGNNNTLTFNKLNSDWNNIATKNGAKLIINNAKITNSGHNDGPWNRHDLNFACDVELNNVTSDKAMAFKADATLNTVTINDANTSATYAIWVQPNGQTITLNECTIDMEACSDGRGIKIDEQYLSAPAKVALNVSETSFTTDTKAAIVVKSAAGADIVASDCDISGVAEDSANLVWVDEDAAASAKLVSVTGATGLVEGTAGVAQVNNMKYGTVADAIAAAGANDEVILLDDSATIPDGYTALANGTVVKTPAAGAVAPTLYVWDTAAKDWATYYIATGDDLDDLKLGADENCLPCYFIDGRYFVDTTEAAATYKLVYGATKLFLAPVDVTDVRYLDKATVFTNVTKETDECGKLVVTDTTKTYYVAYDEDNYDEDYYFVATKNGPIQLLVGGKIVDVAPNGAQDLTAHVWKGHDVVNNAYTTAKCENCGKVVKLYATGTAAGKGAHYEAGLGYITKIDNGFGTTVVTPSTDKTVTSAETFDAGIAMYVGMSVMAAAGSAVVIGKKKD